MKLKPRGSFSLMLLKAHSIRFDVWAVIELKLGVKCGILRQRRESDKFGLQRTSRNHIVHTLILLMKNRGAHKVQSQWNKVYR